MKFATLLIAAAAIVAAPAMATTVDVVIDCTVEYNQVNFGPLANVNAGDSAIWSFQVDSNNYQNSANYPTRGYIIDENSFSLAIGSETLGLQSPLAITPYFVLRNSDPVADGFMFSDNTDWPASLPSDETGQLDQFGHHFEVGYSGTGAGDVLSSLDILDAVGTYDYTGLTSFYTVLNDSFAEPVGLVFNSLTITPEPTSLALLALGGLALLRRR